MANCTKQVEVIEKIKGVTLELSEAEANTLSQFLAKVGGKDYETGHRDRLNAIGGALRCAGFNKDFEMPNIGVGRIFSVEGVVSCKIVDC